MENSVNNSFRFGRNDGFNKVEYDKNFKEYVFNCMRYSMLLGRKNVDIHSLKSAHITCKLLAMDLSKLSFNKFLNDTINYNVYSPKYWSVNVPK